MSENTVNQTLGEMPESAILARIFPRLPSSDATIVGPGDDCAVMQAPDGRFVVTTDMMVHGPDFRLEWSTPHQLGIKAAATNLSDVAAMGAKPTGMVVSIAAPKDTEVTFLEQIADGFHDACLELAPGCGVVGGDLSVSNTLTISVTAFGDLEGRQPLLRSGARPGDVVAVTGRLGLAGLGLAALFAGEKDTTNPLLLSAQLSPWPPISQGVAGALGGATSAMDISDSLIMDAGRIAGASGVVIVLDESALDDLAAHLAIECGVDASHARQAILYGGEDHALLMTFPADVALPPGFTALGHVVACAEDETPHVNMGEGVLPENGWNPYTSWNGEIS
ncbi:MAG: thiamine-phosphate kinase [Actinomycetota bacterium]|nr:thiamine-phosphate kinase [Aurantimicrobium minutum]MDF9809202.1 thiamine-monophosphate kinase [Aurantimicrobium minutum]